MKEVFVVLTLPSRNKAKAADTVTGQYDERPCHQKV